VSATLSVRGLGARYGGIRVLDGLDLEARAGRLTAVVGPNGAGKTTLLKALSGLMPRAGEVWLDGERMPSEPAAIVARGLAHVAEGRQLFPELTVRENLELGAWLIPRRQRPERLADVFAAFPKLAERAGQLAGSMSGGEQQMLAVARALMGRPRVLMLDEPSLGLAPRMVDEVFAIVRRLLGDGVTVLLVEQNVGQALALAEDAYLIERGRVVLAGPARTLLDSDQIRLAYLGSAAGREPPA
jgi:branched-chain amino acid transport system ATP-binding protein